jgi:phosphate/sulfate permease
MRLPVAVAIAVAVAAAAIAAAAGAAHRLGAQQGQEAMATLAAVLRQSAARDSSSFCPDGDAEAALSYDHLL